MSALGNCNSSNVLERLDPSTRFPLHTSTGQIHNHAPCTDDEVKQRLNRNVTAQSLLDSSQYFQLDDASDAASELER